MLLLQHRGRVTAEQLAQELEVSVRTIYRDIEALGAAGVPVYTEPGRNGGCQLIGGYRTRLTGLTAKEAEALFAAGVPGPVGELGLGTVLGAAQLKLLAALPKDLADRVATAQQRFHVDACLVPRGATTPTSPTSRPRSREDRRIIVRYRHPGEPEAATRDLEPFGLVCKAGTWYLVARRGRVAHVSRARVHELTLLDECFDRPADFDLADYWSTSVAAFESVVPGVPVTVRATEHGRHEINWLVRSGSPALVDETPEDETWTRCVVAFENLDTAFVDLVRLGTHVEVVEPVELRTRLLDTARALVGLYG